MVELLLLSSSVPTSFFCKPFVIADKAKGVVRVRVLPWVASMALAAAFNLKVRSVEKVPVARKPEVVVFPLIWSKFPAAPVTPRAASVAVAK